MSVGLNIIRVFLYRYANFKLARKLFIVVVVQYTQTYPQLYTTIEIKLNFGSKLIFSAQSGLKMVATVSL